MADEPAADETDLGEQLQPLLVVEDEPTWSHPFDTLNLANQAQVIAGAALGTRGPFTIGVHGKWGHGKTSALRQARSLLDYSPKQGKGKRRWPNVVTVWFNAWQYQHEEQPIVPLVATIVRAVDEHLAGLPKSTLKRTRETFGAWARALRSVAYGFSAKATVKVPGFAELEAGMVAKDMIDREEKLTRRDDPLLEQSVYYGAFKTLEELSDRDDDRPPDEQPKVVVFIDDLDRCTPDRAVRLLEHMKLVLAQPGFVFVLGVAREVLEGYLKHRYKEEFHLEEQVERAGQDYLEKIIQLPIDLPNHAQSFRGHVERVLARPGVNSALGVDDLEADFRGRFADLLEIAARWNPRRLVRRLNNLIVDTRVASMSQVIDGERRLAIIGDGEGQVTKALFVEFAVISQAVKEGLGNKGLFDALCRDETLCDQLAADFDRAIAADRERDEGPRVDDLPARDKQRLLAALRLLPLELRELLTTAGGAGKRWLTDHTLRRTVIDLIAARESESIVEAADQEIDADQQELIDKAIRKSLRIKGSKPLTDADRSRVTSLDLDHSGVTDAGLAALAPLAQLQTLYLTGTGVTDAGLAALAPLAQLQTLYLTGTGVTDAGLAALAPLAQLQALSLAGTGVTDAGLAALAPLAQLQTLSLGGTGVTDAGLAALAPLAQLQTLSLGGTGVTDAGLAHLAPLAQLQTLWLDETGVTDAGVAELEEKLPECSIST